MHRFTVGQKVTTKSGTLYRIVKLRHDAHRKLAGEAGYDAISLRDGRQFGPIRLLRESALRAAPVDADFVPSTDVPPPASTCIEHAYGSATRLSFQVKVF